MTFSIGEGFRLSSQVEGVAGEGADGRGEASRSSLGHHAPTGERRGEREAKSRGGSVPEGKRRRMGDGEATAEPQNGTGCGGAGSRLSADERRACEWLLRHCALSLPTLLRAEMRAAGDEEACVVDPRALCHIRTPAAARRALRRAGEDAEGERQLCDGCGTTIFQLYRACNRCACELCLPCAAEEARRQRAEIVQRQQEEADALAVQEGMCAAAADGNKTGDTDASAAEERNASASEQSSPSLAVSRSRRARTPTAAVAEASSAAGAATPARTFVHLLGKTHCVHPMEEWRLCARFKPKLLYELAAAVGSAGRRLGAPPSTLMPPSPLLSREPRRLTHDEPLRAFQAIWRRATPIVVAGVGKALKCDWSPAAFEAMFDEMGVRLVVLTSGFGHDSEVDGTVGAFFRGFAPSERQAARAGLPSSCASRLFKLKDFPPSHDFRDLLPLHHRDFEEALPFAEYTSRRGRLNLASALPSYALPPDLGPKMYAAFGCFSSAGERPPTMEVARSSGGKLPPLECPGSTKLHLDMSDAVNLLMYVHDPGEPPSLGMQDGGHGETGVGMVAEYADELVGEEGEWLAKQRGAVGALWHIWRAEDAPKLRSFLTRIWNEMSAPDDNCSVSADTDDGGSQHVVGAHNGGEHTNPSGCPPLNYQPAVRVPLHDAIHDQTFYVNRRLRHRLRDEEGIAPWTFVQRQGEAVFIPAGCPHQVLNLRSCIKVAQDFVSPESIPRVLALTEEYRALPSTHSRSEDKLGAKAILAHAASHALSELGVVLVHQPSPETQPRASESAGPSSAEPIRCAPAHEPMNGHRLQLTPESSPLRGASTGHMRGSPAARSLQATSALYAQHVAHSRSPVQRLSTPRSLPRSSGPAPAGSTSSCRKQSSLLASPVRRYDSPKTPSALPPPVAYDDVSHSLSAKRRRQ